MDKENPSYFFRRKQLLILGISVAAAIGVGVFLSFFTHREKDIPWTALETMETLPPETEPPTTQAPTQPPVDVNDWRLVVANPWKKLPEDFTVTLKDLPNGHQVDERCYSDLQEMLDDCRAAGFTPYICSSYRTQEKQEALYENKVQRVMNQGYDLEEARVIAAQEVAFPGTSEHQTGLTLDIVDENHIVLDETQEERPTQKWLMENSWKYGFILRYPSDKSDITGIIYEPWHYRYVGREYAKEIYEQGLCLEEYVNLSYG